MSAVRNTIKITYNGEARELKVTFDLIDRVSQVVHWEKMLNNLGTGSPNLTTMARFVYINMLEAGFEDITIDEVYDQIRGSAENEENFARLCAEIAAAYLPQNKKKSSEAQPKKTKAKLKTA